uniref:IQ domain-containing protein N n=1 Tax=Sus scrofa TaxID=9823 RepID=A0A8D1V6Q1_PIG
MQQATQLQVSPTGQNSYQPIPNLQDKVGTLRSQLQVSPSVQSSYQPIPNLQDKAWTLCPQLQMSPSVQSSCEPVPNTQDKVGTPRSQLQVSSSMQSSYQSVPSLQDKAGRLRSQLQVSSSGQSSYQPVPNTQDKVGTPCSQLQVSSSGQSSYHSVPNVQDKVGTPHSQLQVSSSGQSSYQPVPNTQDKVGMPHPQPQHEPPTPKETLLQQLDKDKMVARRIPRLRAVVESQAFKNVLVDEMDMMLSRAATLIQANWRGYRLRQKLISQMMAAKAIQEAWRRFNTRRLLRSGKAVEKKVKVEERNIPYHPPQQVRFQHPEEGRSLLAQPIMVNKETQFPSSDSLTSCAHQLALLQSKVMSQPGMQATCAIRDPNVTFLPHQTVSIGLPYPVSLDAKCRPCLLTRTVRSTCLVHVGGDTMKTKQVTARANKAGVLGPPPCGRYAQAVHGQLKTQTQAHMEAEVLRVSPQTGPAPVVTRTSPQPVPTGTITKTPLQMYPAATTKTPRQPCPVPMVTITKTPPQMYLAAPMSKIPPHTYPAALITKTPAQTCPAATMIKTPLQSCLATMMNKTPLQPCPTPMVTVTKTPPQVYQAAPATKTPAQTCPMAAVTKTPAQTCPMAAITKTPAQTCPMAAITKTPAQTCPAAAVTKTPLQTCLATMMNKIQSQPCPVPTITITKTPPQPCSATPMTKTPTQMQPTASTTNTSPQTRLAAMTTKIPPQLCLLASMIKSPTQTRPAATTMTKAPPPTCTVPMMAKTSPQVRPAATATKTPLQTCQVATMSKTPSHQTLQGASVTKAPPPQTRLAAMITKTPAQLRSVATILRTLCLPPPAAGNLKPPLSAAVAAAAAAGIPDTSSHTCLSGPKAKAVVTPRQVTGVVKVPSRSYLTEGKMKCFPPSHLAAGAPKAPARLPLQSEKIKAFSQKQVKTETASHTNVAMAMAEAMTWEKEAEDRKKQAHLAMEVMNVPSQVYVPVGTAVAHPATCPAKVLPQAQPAPCLTTASSQGQLLAELTKALPQAHLGTCLSKPLSQTPLSTELTTAPPQGHPSAEPIAASAQPHPGTHLSKVQSQAHLPTKLAKAPSLAHPGSFLTKAQSQAHLATGVIKVQSQAHLPTGLTKAQSQAQLVTETAKCLYGARQAAELSSKTQSQPFLVGFKASTQPCQHSILGTLPRAKPEDRLTQLPSHGYVQGKVTQGPCHGASETQSMLAPLLASAGHTTCNVESWGDSGAARAQPSTTSPAPPCQEELAASQLASLCAELAAVLGSQDDLRALLAKALSQGEVRAALNQALSKEVLGATVAKALPQGILGTALVKALSWGELGTTLSRALSRGELRAELTKVIQGRLADVLSKALTEEERATLSQALCQGELGAVLSQSLSQAALRSGVVLPKAASKTAGSGMTVMPSPVEVDYRGNQLASWGPSLGPMRLQPNKVRVPWGGAWEGFVTGWPSGFLEERGDGAMLVGSPCSSVVSVGTSLTAGVITAIHQYPLIAALDPTLSWETGPSSDSLNLYLSPEVFENVYLHPRASELTSDLHPMLGDMDPNLSNSPHLQPPPGLWQPLIANGVGPSTSQPSLAGGSTTPSSHSPHEVSRVAPRPWASSREGRVASGKLPNTKGGGRAAHSHQCAAAYGGSTCWCQPSGVSRVPPGVRRPSATKGLQQPSVVPEETMQRTRSPNRKRPSMGTRDVTSKVTPSPPHATMVSRPQAQIPKACVITPGSVAPGHRWALRTQANPTLFQASPGNKLAPTLPRTAIPRQEKSRKGDAVSSVPSPQKLVTSHIINELVATLPQAPDNDLARSFSQDSTDYGPNMSNSQSSLRSCSSRSLSTMSMASLTALDLVEEESWEASLDRDLHLGALQSGEAMEGSQGPGTMGGTESTDHRAMIPKVHDRSSPALEQTPILHRSSVASRLTLSVHWGSDDQDEGDMFSGQSSMDLEESLSQKPRRTGLTRSLSLSNVVPTVYWQLPMPGRLTPYLSQPTVASKVSPNRGQPFMAIRDTSSLFELSAANKMTPSLWQTSRTDSMGLCLSQPSRVSGVTLSLTQPSVTGGMAPSLAQASMIVGGAPNLAQPLVTGEGVPSLVQPLMTGGGAPSLIQPLMTGGVAHSLAQPPLASRGVPSLAQASMTGRLATSQAQTLMTSAVQPPVTGGVIPGLAQSPVTCWVPSSLAQSSMTSGLYPSLAQASMFSGGAPYLAQPSVTGEGAPSLAQPLVTGEGDPSLAQPLVTGEGDPSLAQPLVTGEGAPSLAQPSMTGGVSPSLAQPSMTGGITPSLDQPPVTSGVPPSLEQSSMTSEVYPSLAQAPMFSGGAPYLAQPSVANRVASNLAQSLATHGVAPSLAQASMTGGVYPSLNQSSRVGGVAPCLAKLPMTSRVTSSLAQPCMTSRVAPSLGQTSVAGDVLPSMVQPSKIDGMTCSLAHPPVTGGVGLSIGQTSRVGGAAPSLAQSSLTTGMTPNLGHPSLIIGVAPCLAQPSFAVGMAPGLGQPSMEYREAPCLGQPSMASGVFSSLTQPSVARRGPPSLAQPSMISGTGCTLGQPSWSSRVGSNLPSSRVNAVAPSLHHSSFAIDVTSCTPYPMVANGRGRGLSQPTVSTKVDPHQDPLMISGVASNPQAPEFSEVSLGFHQPPSVSGRPLNITEQPSVTVATPNRYQASAASREDPGLGQGPGMSQGILFRGMAASMSHGTMAAGMLPNMSQGTLAAGMFLSMSRVPVSPGMTGSMGRRSVATGMNASQSQAARGTTPIISRASVAGAPLTCEPASGKGPGFSWASGPCGLGKTSSKFSLISMGPSTQVKVDLPVPLDYQYPGSMSSYQPTHAVIQEPGMGMASAVVPGSVTSRITAALVPGTVAGGMAPSFSPGSVGRGMGQSLIPGSMMSSVASSLSPGYMVNGVVHTFPPGSVICGVGQGLPPGSAIGGMSQGLPLDPMTNPVAQSLPPGSEASGMARTLPLSSSGTGVSPGPIAASGGGGKRQDFSVGPSVSLTAPNLLPGSVAGGVDPSVPIAPNVVPASTPGGLNQNLPMASAPGSPSTTGYVAQSLPQGSMLIGLTPRPYHGALAGEGPTASFHAPHDTGPAQVHPQALEANGTAKGVAPVPTVLQRASQLSQALGMMPFETIGRQSVKKSEDPDKSLPQGSLTRTESEILEATPWLYHSPLATDIDYSQEFPAEDETLPKGQRPLLEEVAPSQAKTVTSGVASVPSQSPSFAKHPMASGGPPTLQQRSATSWRVPSSHFVAASGVPDVQMESVKGTGAPLAHQQASVPPAAPQRPSVAHITPQKPSAYQKSLVAHIVPQRHSHKMMASTAVSGSPNPAHSDSMASSLHRGSVAGIVTPSTPQRSGSTSMASQVPLHPSLARGVEAGGFQKPVSRGLIQNGHGSLGPRKSYRAMHDIPASEMPSSSEAQTVPPNQEQEDAPRSLQEVPRPSTGAVPAIMPIIRTGEAAHGVAITRLNPGVRRVSLGYESSPDGSRRPLFSHESPLVSQDSLSSRAPLDSHQPSLTPAVLQGPEDAGVSGGQAWNSAIPSVAVGPRNSTIVPGGTWEPARGTVPWEATGGKAAVDPSQPGELVASVQAVEKIIIHAAVIIQACTRGYLVRRTIKVWHQWAIIIQAAWRGYCVRRDLAQLCRAATIIQAAWRGFCVRRSHTQQMLLPAVWAAVGGGGGGARSISDHRCYQSCQPHACSLCQSLSSGLGSPPSVVMLVGSSPRTCHMCGHTLPTRVVQGTGRGAVVQASMPRGCSIQPTSRSPPQPHSQNKAATTIQSSWRGFRVRRQLKQQQVAAKMLQASWRGRCTRASLTTDALLGPAAWDNSRHTQWPGV